MTKIWKKFKAFLNWMPKENHVIWHRLDEKQKIYPYRFMNKAEKEIHERKLALHISLNMYD